MADDFALPVAFHFSVYFAGPNPTISDAAFSEVSGLESSIELETVVEGGENRFVHQLPKPARQGKLTLKRGLTDTSSGLVTWCKDTLEGGLSKRIEPKALLIKLLDETGSPVASWTVDNAYPVKWSIGGFDAMKSAIAIETIELSYLSIVRTK